MASRRFSSAFTSGTSTTWICTLRSYVKGSKMTDKTWSVGFVSYARDPALVDRFMTVVADRMRLEGVDPSPAWPPAGSGLAGLEKRADALAASDAVVVFVGGATDSPWANFEIGVVVGGEKTVVPVYLTEDARRGAPPALSRYAGIDAHDQKPDEVAVQIADVIRAAA
jgi:hypothetical protein